MIIDSEGGKIKFMYLQIILQNKYGCLSSLLATVDYVSQESELDPDQIPFWTDFT